MRQFFKSIYLSNRFFVAIFTIAGVFVFAYFFPTLLGAAKLLFYLLLGLLLFDLLLLYLNKTGIQGERLLPEKLSNGDANTIEIGLANRYQMPDCSFVSN